MVSIFVPRAFFRPYMARRRHSSSSALSTTTSSVSKSGRANWSPLPRKKRQWAISNPR